MRESSTRQRHIDLRVPRICTPHFPLPQLFISFSLVVSLIGSSQDRERGCSFVGSTFTYARKVIDRIPWFRSVPFQPFQKSTAFLTPTRETRTFCPQVFHVDIPSTGTASRRLPLLPRRRKSRGRSEVALREK